MRTHGLVLLLLCGCADVRLQAVEESLQLPELVRFERAFVGHEAERVVSIRNMGRGAEPFEAAIDGPFVLGRSEGTIGTGRTAQVRIGWRPGESGAASGMLVVHTRSRRLEVPIEGFAEEPPPCTSSATCSESVFDPVLGSCVDRPVPDGVPCDAGRCIEDGRCLGGRCAGTAVRCDDGDPCTADACDPVQGCISLGEASACPQPAGPCVVPICDSASGCGSAPAPDGAACALASCGSGGICSDGACIASGAPAPAGTPCSTNCGPGICGPDGCVGPLECSWTYEPPGERTMLVEDLAADSAGNVWLVECDTPGWWRDCDLVSLRSVDGSERVRIAIPNPEEAKAGAWPPAIVADRVHVVAGRTIFAWSVHDGTPRWSFASSGGSFSAIVAAADGGLRVIERSSAPIAAPPAELVAVGADGRERSRLPVAGGAWRLRGDEEENVFLVGSDRDGSLLEAREAGGGLRWSIAAHRVPQGVYAGRLVVGGEAQWSLLHARGGGSIFTFRQDRSGWTTAALNAERVVTQDERRQWVGSFRFDGGGALDWSRQLTVPEYLASGVGEYEWGTGVQLTSRGTAVLSLSLTFRHSDGSLESRAALHEVALADGEVLRSIPLPDDQDFLGTAILVPNRWIAVGVGGEPRRRRLFAITVPGLREADHGWSGERGSSAGALVPLGLGGGAP